MGAAASKLRQHQTSTIRFACALFVFVVALAVYARSLAPTVTLVDSGELIVAARSLGVAHPPGFPLYVLLAHLATLVPIGSVAVRVNFASAFFAALACAVIALFVFEVMANAGLTRPTSRSQKKADRRKGKKASVPAQILSESSPRSPIVLVVSCLVSGLLLTFSRTLWSFGTIAEVYTLTSLLILIIFLLMFRWRSQFLEATLRQKEIGRKEESRVPGAAADDPPDHRSPQSLSITKSPPFGTLYAAAFIFGLALGVHHVSVGLMLPAFAGLVFATAGFGFFASRRLIYAALFALVGLIAIYSYLPLAASRSPIMNWGDPRTFERLWWQVTGKQYQVFFMDSAATIARQFVGFVKLLTREFGPWWLPAGPALIIAGFVAVFRRDKVVFWFLTLVIIGDLAYSLGYEIAEDKGAYYLPALIAMVIAAAFGAEWCINRVISARIASRSPRSIAAGLVLIVPIVALAGNWSYNDRSRYFVAQDYVDNILSTIEPGGMLLTRDWQVYSPLLYFQLIEHRRPDAITIDINQLRRSWYFDYLRRAYPETMAQANNQVEAFLEDLRHWEHDPDLYQRDLTLNQRISSRFYEMILALVKNHIQSAPVYLTLDIAANRDGQDSELTKSLAASYQFVPQGLVFEITTDREFRLPVDTQLMTRGLADGTLKFDDDDVVMLKVLPIYVNMLYNRGRYLSVYGRHEQAIEAFRRSLDLNPRFTLAQQAMSESQSAVRKGAANSRQ
jgi:tetratricopeptide (TPR) repeat protein